MAQVFTPDCPGDFKHVLLDDNVEKEIADIIRMFEMVSDENEVQRQLEMFKAEGLIKTYEGYKDIS